MSLASWLRCSIRLVSTKNSRWRLSRRLVVSCECRWINTFDDCFAHASDVMLAKTSWTLRSKKISHSQKRNIVIGRSFFFFKSRNVSVTISSVMILRHLSSLTRLWQRFDFLHQTTFGWVFTSSTIENVDTLHYLFVLSVELEFRLRSFAFLIILSSIFFSSIFCAFSQTKFSDRWYSTSTSLWFTKLMTIRVIKKTTFCRHHLVQSRVSYGIDFR